MCITNRDVTIRNFGVSILPLVYHDTVIYYIKLKSRLSVRPSALFLRSGSQPWLHGSTSDLLDVIALSSGMTKFIFKSF